MTPNAQQILDERCRRYRKAGGDSGKPANPLVDAPFEELAVAFRGSLLKADVEHALEELATASCVTKHQPGHFTLTPVGVRRGSSQ